MLLWRIIIHIDTRSKQHSQTAKKPKEFDKSFHKSISKWVLFFVNFSSSQSVSNLFFRTGRLFVGKRCFPSANLDNFEGISYPLPKFIQYIVSITYQALLSYFPREPVTMVSPDLDEPAHIVDQTCQRYVRFRPFKSYRSHDQASHRPFHEPEDILYAAPHL